VLARKWRPQVFEEVIGQRPITQTLQNAISQNRVSHAFLFTGARGVGKTSTARILAKALNCEKGPQTNPCNQCITCNEITHGNSIDVMEIDGASNRGIDEIRELRDNVRYTPAKSRYKIYIIDEVHMLTREAFNALLKTLEEPPPHVIFIFATTEPHKIPATILSRCQRYDFKRIPLREIMDSLKRIIDEERIQVTQRGILSIAQESEGSLRDAQSLLDQVISYGGKEIRDQDIVDVLGLIDRKILYDTVEALASRDAGRCLEIIEHAYRYGVDLQYFCRELLQYLRNLILIKVSHHPEGLMELPEEELKVLKSQAARFQFDHLDHLFSLLLKGEEEVAQFAFPRTMMEMTLIRMATLKPILPIDEILKKLEIIEKEHPSWELAEQRKPSSSNRSLSSDDLQKGRGLEEGQGKAPIEMEEGEVSGKEAFPTGLTEEMESPFSQRATVSEGSLKGCENEGESQKVLEETWKGLVEFTRARNPILGSFLALGNLIHISDEKIEFGFEKASFHYDRILEKENRRQLEAICHEYLQRKAKVIISPLEQGVRSKGRGTLETERISLDEVGKRIEKGREENSLIQEALRLFDGKIVEG
jgi:DNA polymerase-3 subunit gamma/tau